MSTFLSMKIKKILKIFLIGITSIFLLLLFIIGLFYFPTSIYNFPPEMKFVGDKVYNPYQNISDSVYRANFHAHTVAWKGVTSGHNTEKDVYDGYTNKGYQIAGISNYHNISNYAENLTDLYIPVYEHGYNVLKSHYLVLNAKEVSFFDFPLFQTSSHQQKVIDKIKKKNDLLVIAHPKFGGGRTFENMKNLVNYEFTEVLNHYRTSDEYWDKALSAGRLTWILANDDTHDLRDDFTYRIWNIIYSDQRNRDTIVQNLKKGMNYGVKSFNGTVENQLLKCTDNGNLSYTFSFKQPVDTTEFIGQDGLIKKIAVNSDTAEYRFLGDDTYIRVVAKNKNSIIYMNPLVRYDGQKIPYCDDLKADENILLTWIFRIILGFVLFILVLLLKRLFY